MLKNIYKTIGLFFFSVPSLFAQTPAGSSPIPQPVAVVRVDIPIEVDGVLDDESWRQAAVVRLPFEVMPGRNTPAAVTTECRLAFDARYLYFGCDAADPDAGAIRAFLGDRDATTTQDRIGITLDTFADTRRAFVLSVTALGVQGDAVFDQQTLTEHSDWNGVWSSAGRITSTGYSVEAAIPLRTLRYPGTRGEQHWRFYFWRSRPRTHDVQMRSTTLDPAGNCALCTTQTLTGLNGLQSGGAVDITPTLTGRAYDATGADPQSARADGDAGLDVRWTPVPDLSVNVTLNPDFSQIEADTPQIEANERFAISFPERRPFFLEGAEIFSTPIDAVFTRTIADPHAGFKVAGRVSGTTVGLLVARDSLTNVLLPGLTRSRLTTLDGAGTTTIARVRRDIWSGSSVGALYTGRGSGEYNSHTGGLDVSLRPVQAVTIRAQALRSATLDAPNVEHDGYATYVGARYATREWDVEVFQDVRSPGFRADAGLEDQVGYVERQITARRFVWAASQPWFSRFMFGVAHWPLKDWNGALAERWQYVAVEYQGPWQSRIAFYPRRRTERLNGVLEQFYTPYYGFSLTPSRAVSVTVNANGGSAIAHAHGLRAQNLELRPEAGLRAGRHVDVQARYAWQRLTRDDVRLLDAHASQLRTVYNFSTRLFLRATLQYRRESRAPGGAVLTTSRTESLLLQLLLSYKLNPDTVLYAGTGSALDERDDELTAPPETRRTSRTVFLKLGYGFRL